MTERSAISPILEELTPLCPSGYALALHITFTTPTFLFQTYSSDWTEHYSQNGMVLFDPVVRWGFENTGVSTWGALAENDSHGVLKSAGDFGLNFGTVISIVEGDSRTIGGFARPDRNHTEEEIEKLTSLLKKVHYHTIASKDLSEEDQAALKRLSISLTHG